MSATDRSGQRLVTVDEAASRLGVKPETIYAYVSRGLMERVRAGDGRASLIPESEVDRMASGRRGVRLPAPAPAAPATAVSSIGPDGLRYRGLDAVELAETHTYEDVAALLWTGDFAHTAPLVAPEALAGHVRAALDTLPRDARQSERVRVAAAVAAAWDPMRFDLRTEAVLPAARTLLGVLVDTLPLAKGAPEPPSGTDVSLARRLWARLSAADPRPAQVRVLDAAMTLLADHGMAASTQAARAAAVVRAHPYAVVSAGLGALDGPLHGAAGAVAYDLLGEVLAGREPGEVVERALRAGPGLPGFGQRLYPDGDPRAAEILRRVYLLTTGARVRRAADALVELVADRGQHPNVDFALAVLAHVNGMRGDATETVMAVSRCAGWIAHALEEYARPLRSPREALAETR